jgi:hypothetical protein
MNGKIPAHRLGLRALLAFASLLFIHHAKLGGQSVPLNEDAVYNAVLDYLFESGTRVVVEDSTFSVSNWRSMPNEWIGIESFAAGHTGLIEDFVRRNETGRSLASLASPKVVVVSQAELYGSGIHSADDATQFWRTFPIRFPGKTQTVRFSREGVSDDGTVAMLMVTDSCGGRCGMVRLVRLKHVGDTWTVDEVFDL